MAVTRLQEPSIESYRKIVDTRFWLRVISRLLIWLAVETVGAQRLNLTQDNKDQRRITKPGTLKP